MDTLRAAGVNTEDSTEMFEVMRYISASEAVWRMMGFDINHSDVGCTRLPVHLDGGDWVSAQDGEDGPVYDPNKAESPIEVYFARPAALRALTYLNYYARHSVTKAVAKDRQVPPDASGLRVPPRGRGKAAHSFYIDNFKVPHKVSLRGPNMHVARMHPVPPSAGERYYVRREGRLKSWRCFYPYRSAVT